MGIVNIKMIGPEIKARAGEKVTLSAVFDRPCWSCIHENGVVVKGYKVIKDGKNVYDKDKPMLEKTIYLK